MKGKGKRHENLLVESGMNTSLRELYFMRKHEGKTLCPLEASPESPGKKPDKI
jgi:hypothetical protein